jgi:hypothetical protein
MSQIDIFYFRGINIHMAKPTNRDGYEAVLKHFYVNGKRHGAKQALATALNLSSRAVVDRWQRYGIPHKYAGPLFKLTKMQADRIWPEDWPEELSIPARRRIIRALSNPKRKS